MTTSDPSGIMPRMRAAQLLLEERGDGDERLEAELLSGDARDDDRWGPSTHPLLLGSQALVHLAVRLREQGYQPTDVVLVDDRFTAVEGYEEERDFLVRRLQRGTDDDAVGFMQQEMPGIYVQEVELRPSGFGQGRVTLVQEGIVRVQSEEQVGPLVDALRMALGYRATGEPAQ